MLLLGTSASLPRETEEGLFADGAAGGGRTVIVRVPPIRQGVPTLDKLHAWAQRPNFNPSPNPSPNPTSPGVPTLDKLHAWALTDYTSLAFVDSDVMAVAPLDVFDAARNVSNARGLLIARHPYDAVQAKCGLPLERRGVTALFLMHPSAVLFELLTRHATRMNNPWWDVVQTRHTPEQTGLACYFHEYSSLTTLPCRYLYDVANPYHVVGGHHHRGCLRHGAARWSDAGSTHCAAVAERVASDCLWEGHAHEVRAVHFKGSMKPWTKVRPQCKRLVHGRLRKLPLTTSNSAGPAHPARRAAWNAEDTLRLTEELAWDEKAAVCITQQTRQPVAWAHDKNSNTHGTRLVPRACCSHTVALKAEWHALRPPA